jgi:hypothetical protein
MLKKLRFAYAVITALSLLVGVSRVLAEPKDDKPKGPDKERGAAKAKKAKNVSGKSLLGDKIKRNGRHKLEDHGKFSAEAEVTNGKVAGIKVKHAEKGDVAVTKYKSAKQMAMVRPPVNGVLLAQYSTVETIWIGYAFVDDFGYERIYWFPAEMVIDGDQGAVWYDDAYYYGYGG